MNFYDFLKQKYDNFNGKEGCESCPCKILRDKMLGDMRREICLQEIIYLADKYNIHNDNDVWLCQKCMFISLKIAKKLFGKEFNKI